MFSQSAAQPNLNPNFCKNRDPLADFGKIDNLAQLRNYVLLQLGSPTICVEISEQQMNVVIYDCILYCWRYYMNVGTYEDYLRMDLKKGITHYKLCQELESVVDFELASWLNNGINDLFTVPHNLLYNEIMSMNGMAYGGACWGTGSYGDTLGHWNAALVWMEQARMDLGKSYQIRYNQQEKELSVWPTPDHDDVGLMRVYKRQKVSSIFQNPMFRKMVVAKCGMIWTIGLRKYSLTLAGGGTLNGDSLYASFKEDYDYALEQIRLESPSTGQFFVG